MDFFDYHTKDNHSISNLEKLIPIINTSLLILLLIFLKQIYSLIVLVTYIIRYIAFAIFSFFYYSEYILRWVQNGIDRFNLPLHLCLLEHF